MKFFGQLKKALLELVTGTPSDSVKGRIWYDNTPNRVRYEDNTGVTEIVNTDRVQTISGKIINVSDLYDANIISPNKLEPRHDTISNLTTYALTATNGQLCYATDEKKAYIVIDGLLETISGNTLIGKHEIPTGIINGLNKDFTIAHVPIDGTILVLRDGTIIPNSQISYIHPVITLTIAPSNGQLIEVYYLTEGGSSTIQINAGNEVVENRTITALEITNKKLTLVSTPSTNTRVKVDVRGSTTQIYGLDFIVSGNDLIWDGYDLDGQIFAGSVLRIVYFS